MLKFDFTNETDGGAGKAVFATLVAKFYRVLHGLVDKKLHGRDGHIELVLIGDKKMRILNKEYRDKDSPTDVISFAYLEVTAYEREMGDIIAGDIFISVDTARRQARKNGHSLRREMEILFVHGLLHCFGFDHKNDKQEKEMEKWAKKVLG